ncbi:hypothetical protein ACFXHA_10355 [Nocardia sp. NPDC059240]|uniref:hypothetical protein n=1 Tax=Nocardia sp. NPDC059240 TaxID=3346786 RepID=UPI00369DFC9B
MNEPTIVTTCAELMSALAAGETDIRIAGTVRTIGAVTLPPGVHLRGGALEGGGLRLTRDNTVTDLLVTAPETGIAISNDCAESDLGTLTLRAVRTRGRVLLRADGMVRTGDIEIDGLHVEAANLGGRAGHPAGSAGGARQGAITVVNRQLDPGTALSARLRGLRVGSSRTPVQGCGIVVGGRHDGDGGKLWVHELSIDEVHIGGDTSATRGWLVQAAVLVQPGGYVGDLVVGGPLACYGPRQIALYNRGSITRCLALQSITASGVGGIGVRSLGRIGMLAVLGPLVTYGRDGHGVDLRGGGVGTAAFRSVTTYGAGAIGVSVANTVCRLRIAEDVRTYGDLACEAGVAAAGLSIRRAGRVSTLDVVGSIESHGAGSPALEVGGVLGATRVARGVAAHGVDADAVRVHGVRVLDLEDVVISSTGGQALRLIPIPRRPPVRAATPSNRRLIARCGAAATDWSCHTPAGMPTDCP